MKTKEEILNQMYITANDIKLLIPTLGINQCTQLIKDIRVEMKNQELYVPQSKPMLASTQIFKKMTGIK